MTVLKSGLMCDSSYLAILVLAQKMRFCETLNFDSHFLFSRNTRVFSWILRSRIFFIQSCIYHILQTLKLAWTCAQYTMWDPQDICHKHSLFSWSSPTIWRWWCSDILPTKMCVLVSQIIKIILFVKLILFFLLSFCVPSIYDCYCIM